MQIVTGKTRTNHVKAEYDRAKHAAIWGSDEFVLAVGKQFKVEINGNTIEIGDGQGMMQGTHFLIPFGSYDEVEIEPGATGYTRKDLIVARYEKVAGFESVSWSVYKGEPATSDAQVCNDYVTGNILEGATVNEMPMFEVTVEVEGGSSAITVIPIFTVSTGLNDVYRKNWIDSMRKELTNSDKTIEGSVQELREQTDSSIDEIEKRIDSEVSGINTRIDNINAEIQNIRNQISDLDTRLGALEK